MADTHGMIETDRCDIALAPSPIDPSWIIEGNPQASNCELFRSADGSATTLIWACTEGRFNWFYDLDETIMFLEGSAVIESKGLPPKRYGKGDVILFRNGAHAIWHVEQPVRKVAFLRQPNPFGFGLAVRVVNRLGRSARSVSASLRRTQ